MPPTWALRGRIPYGALTVLAGRPGGGKSQFGIALASQLSQSGVASLLVGDEDGAADTTLPRVLAAGGNTNLVRLFDIENDQLTELPTDVPLLAEAVRETGAAFVVVDPVQAHLAPELNPNVDASLRQATRPLARMAQETGAAVVLITHLRKSTEGGVLDRIGGSGGLVGAARSVLLFGKLRDANPWTEGDVRYACHIKANGARLAPTLECRIESEVVRAGGLSIDTSRLVLERDTTEITPRDLE